MSLLEEVYIIELKSHGLTGQIRYIQELKAENERIKTGIHNQALTIYHQEQVIRELRKAIEEAIAVCHPGRPLYLITRQEILDIFIPSLGKASSSSKEAP